MHKPVLRIIIGSTRPGRVGSAVADWIAARAEEHGGFQVEVADLAELDLPMLNEPNHPATAMLDEVLRWTDALRPLRAR